MAGHCLGRSTCPAEHSFTSKPTPSRRRWNYIRTLKSRENFSTCTRRISLSAKTWERPTARCQRHLNAYQFHPTRQPVVLDFWQEQSTGPGELFTTVANWKQPERQMTFAGEVYHWSKHHEFLKFLDLPKRTSQEFELALSSYEERIGRCLRPAAGESGPLWNSRVTPTPIDSYIIAIARRMDGRERPKRQAPQRLVQRSRGDLPGGRATSDHAGDRIQQYSADRRVACLRFRAWRKSWRRLRK